jgi:hypothetical protein
MKRLNNFQLILIFCVFTCCILDDPFHVLGIPSLNPSAIFKEEPYRPPKPRQMPKIQKPVSQQGGNLPLFLQKLDLSKPEDLKVASRFLISEDVNIKKYGAVFDNTGFSGIPQTEQIFATGTKERVMQQVRSTAKIYVF